MSTAACTACSSVPLSLGLSPRIYKHVKDWRPDLIHVTSPGALPAAGWLYSRLLRVPLVASFHTHVPAYLPRLGLGWLVGLLHIYLAVPLMLGCAAHPEVLRVHLVVPLMPSSSA
jgi:sulfoquinovosyltransferase